MDALIQTSLQETLQQFPQIRLAILFGSLANATATADSDMDLAVLCNQKLSAELKIRLIEALAENFGRPVDLVDLKTAGQPLLGEILVEGKRILGSDSDYARLMIKNVFDRADFLPYRERLLKERREKWLGI